MSRAMLTRIDGGAGFPASGLISGTRIANHSIPAKKLTASAVKALQGQPDGAIPIKLTEVSATSATLLTPQPIRGVEIRVGCDPKARLIRIELDNPSGGLTVSGSYTADGVATPITWQDLQNLNLTAAKTLDLDLVALGGDANTLVSRFDLVGTMTNSPTGPHACDFWGLVTPGT